MLTIAQIAAIVGLLIAFNAPAEDIANVQSILETSSKVEIQAIGGVAPAIRTEGPTPIFFTTSLKVACGLRSFSSLDVTRKDVCLEWWLKEAPIQPDGGTNMPKAVYEYYQSKQ